MGKKRRPITQLPDDLRQIAETARSNAAARIVYGLQSDGQVILLKAGKYLQVL